MFTLRTFILSVVLVLVLAAVVYITATASTVASASTRVPPSAVSASSLSTQALRNILDGRYEHRNAMPW